MAAGAIMEPVYRFFDFFDDSRGDWLGALLLGLAALAMPLSVAIRGFWLWLQSFRL
jgi:hypothetical protein